MAMMKRVPPSKQLNVRLTEDDQAEMMAVLGKGWAWTPSDAVKRALIIAARTPAAEGFQILHAAMRERGAKRAARWALSGDEPGAPEDLGVTPVEHSVPD